VNLLDRWVPQTLSYAGFVGDRGFAIFSDLGEDVPWWRQWPREQSCLPKSQSKLHVLLPRHFISSPAIFNYLTTYNVVPCMLYGHSLYTKYFSTLNHFNWWSGTLQFWTSWGSQKNDCGVMHSTEWQTFILHPLKLHQASCSQLQNAVGIFIILLILCFPLIYLQKSQVQLLKKCILSHFPFEDWLKKEK